MVDPLSSLNSFHSDRPRIPTSILGAGLGEFVYGYVFRADSQPVSVYMVTVLGASLLSVGLIEGFAEATALLTKMFSGVLSDYLGKRKLLKVIGYGMAAVTKPLFP